MYELIMRYMRLRILAIVGVAIATGAFAGIVFAQLGDTQTASGNVNVTTTSADLYICEPGSISGPACGSDDSGANETVFEGLENIRPGATVSWDIRLKNIGTEDLVITGVNLSIVETADPGNDCNDNNLIPALNEKGATTGHGIFRLADAGADDTFGVFSPRFFSVGASPSNLSLSIFIKAGSYEDVRLLLGLDANAGGQPSGGSQNCEANEWSVSWDFFAS